MAAKINPNPWVFYRGVAAVAEETPLPKIHETICTDVVGCLILPLIKEETKTQETNKDFSPILMLSGGILGDMAKTGFMGDYWLHQSSSMYCRYANLKFHLHLQLERAAKRVVDKQHRYETAVNRWAKEEYKTKRLHYGRTAEFSLVHESLEKEPVYNAFDGLKITKLAMSCVEFLPIHRPAMMEIIQCL
ncbi:hypothetical protein L1049_015035 [Liquidambar formosana]|uniref:Uncharacterized protein n=1 Tax=Liquidambar formosana TaxID=63359 RepID=A0AAP0RWV8_LIQFO